jgi:hypothetical protein
MRFARKCERWALSWRTPAATPLRDVWLTPCKTSEPSLRQNPPSEALLSPVHVDVGLRIDRDCTPAALPVSSVLD